MNKLFNYIRTSGSIQSIIVWFIIFLLLFVQPLWIDTRLSVLIASITLVNLLVIYYVTQKLLIPKLLIKGKKIIYIILSIFIIILLANIATRFEIFVFDYFNVKPLHEFRYAFSMPRFITLFILTYTVSSIIFFSGKAAEDAKLKEELISEKKMLEVRVLKSQINSHFLFNALNNIYSMTYFKDEYTSSYVLKLAQMMRYVMEDCETEFTSLPKEIEYIENYIDFQKLRFENDKDISFTYNIQKNMNISVPPMIFQPLVENCFKHTPLDVDKNSYIHISLQIEEKKIIFVSENSQPMIKGKPSTKSTGIGIENVKRRLSLYYKNNYTLNTFNNTECFRVELLINL